MALRTTARLAHARLAHAARRRRGLAAVTQTVSDDEFQKIKDELTSFMHDRIYPNEQLFLKQSHESRGTNGKEWTHPPLIIDLMQEAKQRGLWNLFLPADSAQLAPKGTHLGRGLTNLQYADLCELMGTSVHFEFAATACNCASPDTGNMETIARFGNEQQKEQWLSPLLDGSIRSCFAMTEPDVASSDATNISIDIRDDGDDFVVNGRKWWCTGAGSLHCKVMILMGKTDPEAKAFAQQSMLLVDLASTDGIELVRPLTVFGDDDAPKGHFELSFTDVRIPKSNVLWQRGKGFEIAQRRLGPGRIHHCMRCIGQMERALATMAQRAMKRVAFGKPLARLGGNQLSQAQISIGACLGIGQFATVYAATVGGHDAPAAVKLWNRPIAVRAPEEGEDSFNTGARALEEEVDDAEKFPEVDDERRLCHISFIMFDVCLCSIG